MGREMHRLVSLRATACALALAWAPASRSADLLDDLRANASLALGVSAGIASTSTGTSSPKVHPAPLWAFQYGRIRFSTGGAAAVLGIAQDPRGPGASAELFSDDRVRMGVALRIDRGRDSSSLQGLEGLPNVPATVRARAYASYALTSRWTTVGSISQDVLGRGGGTVATADVGYREPIGPTSEWYAGLGVTWADSRYMNSYYGVPADSAAATGYAAYAAGAGPMNVSAGVGFITALTSRWILFGGAGATQLLGYAADSPLTIRRVTTSVSIGLAYRWGAKYEGLMSVLLPVPTAPSEKASP
jgi:outer membrane protein